jgi:diacylglycerol O-acyltransferase
MTALEALMWRLGRHGVATTMGLVVEFDGPLDAAAVEARLTQVVARVPRLAERVRPPALPMVPPAWEPHPSFDLANHFGVADAPWPAAAAGLFGDGFGPGRPPWRAVLASAEPGRSALVLFLHHSYTDGVGGVKLMAELFDGLSESPPARPFSSSRPVGLGADLAEEMGRTARSMARALPWAGRAVRDAAADPGGTLEALDRWVTAAAPTVAAVRAPASPLLAGRSDGQALDRLHLSLGPMRETAKRLGATLNDVFLAALLEGLALYHDKHGSRAPTLRLGIPISAPSAGPTSMHNQVVGALLRAPLGAVDFEERVRLLHLMVLDARSQPWAPLIEDLAGLALRFPGVENVVARAGRGLDVLASNVPGVPFDLFLGGVRVHRMVPFGPRSGAAVNATLLSYGDGASIGLDMDPAAFPEPGVLVDCVRAGFAGFC